MALHGSASYGRSSHFLSCGISAIFFREEALADAETQIDRLLAG